MYELRVKVEKWKDQDSDLVMGWLSDTNTFIDSILSSIPLLIPEQFSMWKKVGLRAILFFLNTLQSNLNSVETAVAIVNILISVFIFKERMCSVSPCDANIKTGYLPPVADVTLGKEAALVHQVIY